MPLFSITFVISMLCGIFSAGDFGRYIFEEENMDFREANLHCEMNYQTSLASITEYDLNAAKSTCTNSFCWIGINYEISSELWINFNDYRLNTTVNGPQVSGYCLTINQNGTLRTFLCSEKLPFLCNAPSILCDSTWNIFDGNLIDASFTTTEPLTDCSLSFVANANCSMAFEVTSKSNQNVPLVDTYIEMSFVALAPKDPANANSSAGIAIKYNNGNIRLNVDRYLFVGIAEIPTLSIGAAVIVSECTRDCSDRRIVAISQNYYPTRNADSNILRLDILQREFSLSVNEQIVEDVDVNDAINRIDGDVIEFGIFGCDVSILVESLYIFDKNNVDTTQESSQPPTIMINDDDNNYILFINTTFEYAITNNALSQTIDALKNVTESTINSYEYAYCDQIIEDIGTVKNQTTGNMAVVEFMLTELKLMCTNVTNSKEAATNYTIGLEEALIENTANSQLIAIPDRVDVKVEYVRIIELEAYETTESILMITTESIAIEKSQDIAKSENFFVAIIIFFTSFCLLIFCGIIIHQQYDQKSQYQRHIDEDVEEVKAPAFNNGIGNEIMLEPIQFKQQTRGNFQDDEFEVVDDENETNDGFHDKLPIELNQKATDLDANEFEIIGDESHTNHETTKEDQQNLKPDEFIVQGYDE